MRKRDEYQRRMRSVCLICLLCFLVYACGKKQDAMEKIKDLEYTVIAEDNIPKELRAKIGEKKENAFRLTFEDQGFLYICMGYGEQQTGGYSIAVNGLYETANAIYIDTNLIGPSRKKRKIRSKAIPMWW